MGMRGPTPKAHSLRVLEGYPDKRRKGPAPRPQKNGLPRCPGWMSAVAKSEFRSAALQLKEMGLLAEVDMAALAGYATNLSRARSLEAILDVHGYTDADGKARPEVAMLNTAWRQVLAFSVQLGLTPRSRSGLVVPQKAEGDPMERLLS